MDDQQHRKDDQLHRVIGIDLGTTYSAVAAYRAEDLTAEIIPDRTLDGPPAAATPSVVGFDPASRRVVVGHTAKEAMTLPGRGRETIIEIKREMGARFTPDSLARFDATDTAFLVNEPVRVRLHGQWLRPQEVSALVLMHMKEIAERKLGGEVHDAVVTVPAYFKEPQKKATEEAALLAGLHPRQLIPEPTAAAIAYEVDKAETDRSVHLVFDLGGGTFDVSIIETRDTEIEVIATAGDPRLGGGDFDAMVAEWIQKQTGRTPQNADERLRVLAAAEKAKRELSVRESTTIDLGNGITPVELDRPVFESLIQETLDRALEKVDEALRFAEEKKGVGRDDVDGVLLVGGSTRIPQVRRMLLDHFERDDGFVRQDANPDTLVARGAAVVAHRFKPSETFDLDAHLNARRQETDAQRQVGEDDFSITLITEHTLGVGIQDKRSDPLIARGTRIPARHVKRYTNPANATHIEVNIYQGGGQWVYENDLVGTIFLEEIEPRAEGFHQFDVTFSLDENGLLGVKVIHANHDNREYEATFRQDTSITKVSMLGESRARLLRLTTSEPDDTAAGAGPQPSPGDTPFGNVPPPIADTAAGKDVDPNEVPAELRRLYRKVVDWTQGNGAPEDLAAALRDFTDAVRSGASATDLDPLADRLEAAYDRARR